MSKPKDAFAAVKFQYGSESLRTIRTKSFVIFTHPGMCAVLVGAADKPEINERKNDTGRNQDA